MRSAEESVPLGVEQVVAAAVRMLPRFLGGRRPEGMRVEEVVPPPNPSSGEWKVTLSFLEPGVEAPEHPTLKGLLGGILPRPPAPERVLRVVEVDAVTGAAKSMRIRDR